MKKFIYVLAVAMGLSSATLAGATEPVKASIGADLVSNYVWRGQRLDGFSIQPSATLEWGGLSLSSWGSAGLKDGYSEIDFTLSYTAGGFTAGITDYFCADNFTRYFNYSEDTPHVAEINLGYDFGFLSVNWYTNILGAVGENSDGGKAYSSYFEIAVPFSLGGLDWSIAAGASPWENDFYGVDNFGVVNCSLTVSKDVAIGSLLIPAFVQLMANPTDDKMYMCVGVSF